MLSKFLVGSCRVRSFWPLLTQKTQFKNHIVIFRREGHYIPPSQYDFPFPKKLNPILALKSNYELAPIVVIIAIALAWVVFSIMWATQHKVDVEFVKGGDRTNISRTMDLRNPTVHKLVTFNQRYEPWPEMQDVLDKMQSVENKKFRKTNECSPQPGAK